MDENLNTNENGQNLLIFAVIMVVLIALAGLVIDGGFSLSKRREAQNAADSGALAGAAVLCEGGTQSDARTKALDYAITRNKATDATASFGTKVITVTAAIPYQTFLMGIFGTSVVNTTATASAGCFSPCASTGVMPVAWACHDPSQGGDISGDCTIQYGTLDTPGPSYIIMDSNKAGNDYLCQDPPNSGSPAGALDCDINNDGTNDLIVGGGRSWLDLDGDTGGHSIDAGWITNGYSGLISDHLWLPGSDGTSAVIFGAAALRTGDVFILPVFNDYTTQCRPDQDPACSSKWHTGIDDIHSYSATSADYYHIISFSLFKVTCVSKVPGQHCPTKDYLVTNNVIDHQVKTIEGYFIEGYVPGLDGRCDYDAGAYTIYLNH